MTWISGDCRVGRHSRCALPASCACTHHLPTIARLRHEIAVLEAQIEPLQKRRDSIADELDRATTAERKRAARPRETREHATPACKRCGRPHEPRHHPGRYPALCADCKETTK